MNIKQLEKLVTIDELCSVAANLPANPTEGTIEHRFMAGWTNAMDMVDAGEIANTDDSEFKRVALSEVRNYF